MKEVALYLSRAKGEIKHAQDVLEKDVTYQTLEADASRLMYSLKLIYATLELASLHADVMMYYTYKDGDGVPADQQEEH